jgi:P-type conjugative transfer ATPase TrbB
MRVSGGRAAIRNSVLRPMDDALWAARERRRRLDEKLKRELGPTVLAALADPDVLEILLNPDGRLWVDEFGKGMRDTGATMPPHQAESLLGTVAIALDGIINAQRPILEAELPLDGSRITGLIPPAVRSPCFAIRKRALKVFSLDDYVQSGSVTETQASTMRDAIRTRKNILIVGAAGSGKTTFANALLNEIAIQVGGTQRIVILEDTPELQCTAPNAITLRTTDTIDVNKLLRTTLRLRPDRIIMGEIRGAEALTLLKAWSTGHPGGVATIHAETAEEGRRRLDRLAQEAGVATQSELIGTAVHTALLMRRSGRQHVLAKVD